MKNYTGQTISGIKCLSLHHRDKHHHAKYIWQCPRCPKTFEAVVTSVAKKYTRSCGCLRVANSKTTIKPIEPGTQFGDLVVLGSSNKRSDPGNHMYSWCVCLLCHEEVEIRNNSLKSGLSRGCMKCCQRGLGHNETSLLDGIERQKGIILKRHYKIFFSDHFYEVDGYDEKNNAIYEVYEKYHRGQINYDRIRQKEIQDKLKCEFVVIPDPTH